MSMFDFKDYMIITFGAILAGSGYLIAHVWSLRNVITETKASNLEKEIEQRAKILQNEIDQIQKDKMLLWKKMDYHDSEIKVIRIKHAELLNIKIEVNDIKEKIDKLDAYHHDASHRILGELNKINPEVLNTTYQNLSRLLNKFNQMNNV